MNLLLYSIFDTLILLVSTVIAIIVGDQFQPNPIAFLLVFLGSRFLLYNLWFKEMRRVKTPWLRLAIHSIVLVLVLPLVFATTGYLFPGVSNNLFWFLVIPVVGIVTSWMLHRLFILSQE